MSKPLETLSTGSVPPQTAGRPSAPDERYPCEEGSSDRHRTNTAALAKTLQPESLRCAGAWAASLSVSTSRRTISALPQLYAQDSLAKLRWIRASSSSWLRDPEFG
eukprot:CAMPEP_0180197426 /NCGR_PEP_ID=MMETSP0987-20121128/4629_1 /TAXON_ID=697907 /ORGANISM="non described non described, Strain CCMP2293" /LENGTH=105 /DNA_ID=CAMNT_0022152363 /DNA_START=294 /DNA_END=608 /DNA_ORIENTATION=+